MFALDPSIELTSFLAQGYAENSLKSRAAGAYLGLAVGDAPGATVEFLNIGERKELKHLADDLVAADGRFAYEHKRFDSLRAISSTPCAS